MKIPNVMPNLKGVCSACMYCLLVLLCRPALSVAEAPQVNKSVDPVVAQEPTRQTAIPPDPAAQGYTLAPGVRKIKKKLFASGYSINLDNNLIWMDEHRIIINYYADRNGVYAPAQLGNRSQPKILILDVDTGEIEDAPYVGHLSCYSEGRIAIRRFLFPDDLKLGSIGMELALGKYGETLQIPVPGGEPKDMTLNKDTCQLEPKDPVAEKQRRFEKWGGGVSIKNEKVKPVKDPSVNLGRFDKNNPYFSQMNVAYKEQWVWHGKNGEEKVIETNEGEIFTGGGYSPVYLPFEGGAYYFRTRMDTTLPAHVYIAKFNRLVYPDGRVVRLPVPDLLWRDYVSGGGKVGLSSSYTKAGVIWRKGEGKFSVLPHGSYLEDKSKKQLIKLESIGLRDTTLFPDGCRFISAQRPISGRYEDFYIMNICEGE